jgi:Tfp pilus assembly protein PilZ
VSGRERRRFPRWSLHAAVDVLSDDRCWSGLSYDVSAGGIFVATLEAPPLGLDVTNIVMLPDGTRLSLRGVVRWVRATADASGGLPAGFGVEWHELPMSALRAMLHFAELRDVLFWDAELER